MVESQSARHDWPKFIRDNFLEICAGAVGAIFTGLSFLIKGEYAIIPNIVGVLGTFLTGMAAAKIYYNRSVEQTEIKAATQIHEKLSIIHNTISGEMTNLSRVVTEYSSQGDHDITTFVERVRQSTYSLATSLNNISTLTGDKIEAQAESTVRAMEFLGAISQRLGALYIRLETEPNEADKEKEIKTEIKNITQQIGDAMVGSQNITEINKSRALAGKAELQLTDINCPFCNSVNKILLGNRPGETSVPICRACGERFNAHRVISGVQTRKPGVNQTTRQIIIACPVCSNSVTARVAEGSTEDVKRICFSCSSELSINPVNGNVHLTKKVEKLETSPIDGQTVLCPRCGIAPIYLALWENKIYNFCPRDDVLVVHRPLSVD